VRRVERWHRRDYPESTHVQLCNRDQFIAQTEIDRCTYYRIREKDQAHPRPLRVLDADELAIDNHHACGIDSRFCCVDCSLNASADRWMCRLLQHFLKIANWVGNGQRRHRLETVITFNSPIERVFLLAVVMIFVMRFTSLFIVIMIHMRRMLAVVIALVMRVVLLLIIVVIHILLLVVVKTDMRRRVFVQAVVMVLVLRVILLFVIVKTDMRRRFFVQAVVTILVMGLAVIMTLALRKPQDHIGGKHTMEESGCNGNGSKERGIKMDDQSQR
jgi:hypothetical protein